MEFDNTLEVPLPPADAWAVLLDIESIATCIPGAERTAVVDDRTPDSITPGRAYKGKVAVRLGPVALTLAGHATFEAIDDARHTAKVRARGSDPKGRGTSDSVIDFRLEPHGAGTRVLIHTNVTLSGSCAIRTRAGMNPRCAALIAQFGDNLKATRPSAQCGQPVPAAPVTQGSGLVKSEKVTRATRENRPEGSNGRIGKRTARPHNLVTAERESARTGSEEGESSPLRTRSNGKGHGSTQCTRRLHGDARQDSYFNLRDGEHRPALTTRLRLSDHALSQYRRLDGSRTRTVSMGGEGTAEKVCTTAIAGRRRGRGCRAARTLALSATKGRRPACRDARR